VVGEIWTRAVDLGRYHVAQLPQGTYYRAAILCLGTLVGFVLASIVRKVLILLTLQSGNMNPPQREMHHVSAGEYQHAHYEKPEQGQLYSNQVVRFGIIVYTWSEFSDA
jgi:hypothetical protein